MSYNTDVIIIGAGPVGLFAIFECGMHKLSCHVVDALDTVGGQCRALYPEKPIYDIPAHPSILAGDLVAKLEEQAAPFNPVFHLGQQATEIKKTESGWFLKTSAGTEINAKALIIAAGVGAFGPNKPPLENLEDYEKNHVHYYVKRMEDFRDQTLVIAGGGDSAVDWALNLHGIAKKIYMVHRRDKFRAAAETVSQLKEIATTSKSLELVTPYQLSSLKGTNGLLESVEVSTLDGKTRSLEATHLLAFFGLSMDLGPLSEWGMALQKKHIEVNFKTCETNLKGIFAIGDVATYENKQKLILTGFAEAAQAAHAIRSLVYPGEVFHFEYSTTQGLPGAQ
jgi:thioredoxin reductase (NADPH)